MSLSRTVLALVITTLCCLGQAGAQERTIRVGVPTGPRPRSTRQRLFRVLVPMPFSFLAACSAGFSRKARGPLGSSSRVTSFWWDRGRRWHACEA